MSRVLLFGGSGFLGGRARAALAADPGVAEVICPGRDRYDLLGGDLDSLTDLICQTRPDVVINCTGRLAGTGLDLILANAAVTAKLIGAIGAAAPGARFVRLGSASEYGVVAHGHAVAEDDPTVPVSTYGVSHLAGTSLVRLASEAGQVDGVVLRVFNPVGPGMRAENLLGLAAQRMREALLVGADHLTLGSLGSYRDFVDVADVAAALAAAAFATIGSERVINIGSGQAVTCRHAVELLARAAGFTGEIREAGTGPARSIAVDWIRADIDRAARVLGWKPARELADSVAAIWREADG